MDLGTSLPPSARARSAATCLMFGWWPLIAAVAGLLFGYDFVVIGGAQAVLREILPLEQRMAQRLGQQSPCWVVSRAPWRRVP